MYKAQVRRQTSAFFLKKSSVVETSLFRRNTASAHRYVTYDQVVNTQHEKQLDIFNIDVQSIFKLKKDYKQIKNLIDQLDNIPILTDKDVTTLLMPMSQVCGGLEQEELGAELLQKLIFQCLKRIPPNLEDRAHQKSLPYPVHQLYTRTIVAWGSQKSLKGAEKAERIFQLQMDLYQEEMKFASEYNGTFPVRAPPPTRPGFKSLLRAWALSGDPKGTQRAWELIQTMEHLSDIDFILGKSDRPSYFIDRPDIACYNLVLRALGPGMNEQGTQSLERATEILTKIETIHNKLSNSDSQYNGDYIPDHFTYREILRTYGLYLGRKRKDLAVNKQLPSEIRDLIKKIHLQDKAFPEKNLFRKIGIADTYGRYIQALVAAPYHANLKKAFSVILELSGKKENDNFTANPYTWPRQDNLLLLLKSIEKSSLEEKNELSSTLLDIAAETPFLWTGRLSQAMTVWSHSGISYSPELVEAMLFYNMNSNARFKVTGEHFALCLTSWLDCAGKNTAQRAENVFSVMLDEFERNKDPRVAPKEIHLHYLMLNWLKNCDDGKEYDGLFGLQYPAEHIESLLMFFCENGWVTNPVGCFATAIRAWAAQKCSKDKFSPNPVQRAAALLHSLSCKTDRINGFPVNWALEVCKLSKNCAELHEESLSVAVEIFHSFPRNPRTYVLMSEISELYSGRSSDKHTELVEKVFEEACKDGNLTQKLLNDVLAVTSRSRLQSILGISYFFAESFIKTRDNLLGEKGWFDTAKLPAAFLVQNLPPEWSKNTFRSKSRGKPRKAGF